jgi:hypothetical protein
MNIFIRILGFYGIAFCISMFVAFIIWAIYQLMSDSKLMRYTRKSTYEELRRLNNINKLRKRKLAKVFKDIEEKENNDLIEFYYGSK